MIHMKSHSLLTPTSTMCNRRHKGMIQTSIILILFVCIGYGFYLHNLLQVKIKYLDTKALRHQGQQQSLSSQLQSAYEDRARLEKAVQEAKSERQRLKEEKETLIQEMLIEHQDKNQALEQQNKDFKEKNKQLSSENADLKNKYAKVYKDHEELKDKHQKALTDHAKIINGAHEEVAKYKSENDAYRRLRLELEGHVKEAQGDYQLLQDALKAVPADALNFNHPAIQHLDFDVKKLLLGHLGDSREDMVQVQQTKPMQKRVVPMVTKMFAGNSIPGNQQYQGRQTVQNEVHISQEQSQYIAQVSRHEKEELRKYSHGDTAWKGESDEHWRQIHEAEVQMKKEEQFAKRELENQQQSKVHNDDDDELQLASRPERNMGKSMSQTHTDEQDLNGLQHVDQIRADIADEVKEPGEDGFMQEKAEYQVIGNRLVKQEEDTVQVVVPPAAQVADHDPEAIMDAPPAKIDEIDSQEVNGEKIIDMDPNDPVMQSDNDDNVVYEQQQDHWENEPGMDNGQGEDEEEGNYNEEQNDDLADTDKIDDQKMEDDYANEMEEPQERKLREDREHRRIKNDRYFDAMNNAQKMIPGFANMDTNK